MVVLPTYCHSPRLPISITQCKKSLRITSMCALHFVAAFVITIVDLGNAMSAVETILPPGDTLVHEICVDCDYLLVHLINIVALGYNNITIVSEIIAMIR